MAKIFISYRRADTSGESGRLYDRLRQTFGNEAVFMDAGNIPLGADFSKIIDKHLSETDLMLVVIGPNWLNAMTEDGKRRLDDPNDFVRREIRAALAPGIATIPILVNNARMPSEADLPPEIYGLAGKQGLQLYHDLYDYSIDKLLEAIKQAIKWSDEDHARKLESEIARYYNNVFSISSLTENFKLTVLLEDGSVQGTFWNSHVFKKIITKLIETADLSKWAENEDIELQPSKFWKDILVALAQSIYLTDYHDYDPRSAKEILQATIDSLGLDQITIELESDDDDDFVM